MTVLTFLMLTLLLGVGFYYFVSEYYSDVIIGLALVSTGVNFLLIEASHKEADPLPQALILTAVVIGFGLISFFAAFILFRMQSNGNDQILAIKEEPSKDD